MSAEISVVAQLSANKVVTMSSGTQSLQVDMAGEQMISNVQIVGTSPELLQLGDVSTIGWVLVRNMDPTNYVELALDISMTYTFGKLLAGEAALFRAASATLYARANTGACNCQVVATEA